MTRSNAERQKAYRERRAATGNPYRSGTSGPSSKWSMAQFIAIDGEGENIGKPEKYVIEGKTYHAKEHIYTLLAASSGESLYNDGKRLETMACIDWLLSLAMDYPKAIFVIFAGGYDINHIVMFGFEREQLRKLGRGETISFKVADCEYEMELRQRKSLTIRRGLTWKTNSKGQFVKYWATKITLWDVFGYYQENFIGVMRKWLGESHPHYALIKNMKARRGDFENVSQADINAYNAAELEVLSELMIKLRDAVDGLGLKLTRWDGAGSIAAAMMRLHKIEQFKSETPNTVIEACRTAYAGGRIEVCKIGTHKGTVYDYDINSAYPYVMSTLPCMAHGEWSHSSGLIPPSGFTLVHCRYNFARDLAFYALFYRNEHMQISFPRTGEGWYWYPEYEAALDCPGILEVIESWHFEPGCNHKPFHWIEEYYRTRQQWTKNPLEEWQKGGEKIIKLGLNSLYGKTAQQLGGRDGKAPAYHQLEWAGYITSATRARLYRSALLDADAVIGFATDGLFMDKPINLASDNASKIMGGWSCKVVPGLTLAMAGVYWFHKGGGGYEHFSRGFDKDAMQTPERVVKAWHAGQKSIDIPMQRLIGIGSACASDTLWRMRGRFTQGMRTLKIDGDSPKRHACNVSKDKPHLRLVSLKPQENFDYEMGLQECSFPYPLEWITDYSDEDYAKDLELIKELQDTENI